MTEIKYYIYELLKSINQLKELGIFHRDVKPGNFLYNTKTKKGILIDFGLSELVKTIHIIILGSRICLEIRKIGK